MWHRHRRRVKQGRNMCPGQPRVFRNQVRYGTVSSIICAHNNCRRAGRGEMFFVGGIKQEGQLTSTCVLQGGDAGYLGISIATTGELELLRYFTQLQREDYYCLASSSFIFSVSFNVMSYRSLV